MIELADAIATVRKFHEELERPCQLSASSADDSSSTTSSSSTVQTDSTVAGSEAVQTCATDPDDMQQSGGWKFLKPVEDYDQRVGLRSERSLLEMWLWSWNQVRKRKSSYFLRLSSRRFQLLSCVLLRLQNNPEKRGYRE